MNVTDYLTKHYRSLGLGACTTALREAGHGLSKYQVHKLAASLGLTKKAECDNALPCFRLVDDGLRPGLALRLTLR